MVLPPTYAPQQVLLPSSPRGVESNTLNNEQVGLINYHCDVCGKDITHVCRIRCAECEDFDLCVDCFRKGAEFQSEDGKKLHKSYHRYIPIGRNTFPLYKLDWSADEEIMLLEGVSKFGLGNWNEIAELVNTVASKSKRSHQCERHYYDVYLNSRTNPVPDSSKLLTSVDGGPIPLSDDLESTDDEKPEVHSHAKAAGATRSTHKPSHQVVGYWPLRGDFDIEYDNDAELILADMDFKDDETAQERHLKLQVIEIYNSKLDERLYRKRTVIERGLLDVKSLQQKEKKRSKEERELHNLFRPLARFHSEEEHERFVQLLIEEKRIRTRLHKLQEWKSLGLKSIEDVRLYEEEKKRRDELKSRGITFPVALETHQRSNKKSRLAGKPEETIDFSQYPGSKFLDEQERAFCENASLPPVFYLLSKRILLHEASSNEQFNRQMCSKVLKIGASKSGQLYDFFLSLDLTPTPRGQLALLTNSDLKISDVVKPNLEAYSSSLSKSPLLYDGGVYVHPQNTSVEAKGELSLNNREAGAMNLMMVREDG